MKDEQYDGIIRQLRSVNERLLMIEDASHPKIDPLTPKELEAFAEQLLTNQNAFGPSIRTTLDWSGAFRIVVVLTIFAGIGAFLFYALSSPYG